MRSCHGPKDGRFHRQVALMQHEARHDLVGDRADQDVDLVAETSNPLAFYAGRLCLLPRQRESGRIRIDPDHACRGDSLFDRDQLRARAGADIDDHIARLGCNQLEQCAAPPTLAGHDCNHPVIIARQARQSECGDEGWTVIHRYVSMCFMAIAAPRVLNLSLASSVSRRE
jgi:hypothetical protein